MHASIARPVQQIGAGSVQVPPYTLRDTRALPAIRVSDHRSVARWGRKMNSNIGEWQFVKTAARPLLQPQ
eukprot:8910018-Pyramimonas_sp.AAC.1